MNLTKKEITAFIGILLKKNPLIDIDVEEDKFILKYFNGNSSTIKIQTDPIVQQIINNTEIQNPANWEEAIDVRFEQISEAINTQLSQIEQPVTRDYVDEAILKYCQGIAPTIVNESIGIDYDKIKHIIDAQLSVLKEEFKQTDPVDISGLLQQTDFISFKNEISSLFLKLKKQVEQELNTPTSAPQPAPSSPDYQYIEKLIDTKLDNITQTFVQKDLGYKIVTGIEPVHGNVSVTYNDGSTTNLEDLLTPLIRTIVGPMVKSRAVASVGAGGYGGGSPGLSAYDIAVKNGFVGSEQDWLDSLSGGYVAPQDGTIVYDVDGNITDIIVGTNTTTINRDSNNIIISVTKSNYIKEFIRDSNDKIIGWNIINI